MYSVSLVGVLVAAVVAFVVGFLFHGPLFGKLWMRLADVHPTGNEKFSDMYGQMFMNLVMNVVAAYALAVVYSFAVGSLGAGVGTRVACGILVAIGFQATASSMEVIWMKRSVQLYLFECVSMLVGYIAMGIVIASM